MNPSKAFTLVELLIVVIILGILAVIVIPSFSNASQAASASMLADGLRVIRTQLAVYKGQHRGVAPGYPDGDTTAEPTEDAFNAQMTQASNKQGVTAAPGTEGFPFGPYFSRLLPNPVNSLVSVNVLGDAEELPAAPTGDFGWIYQPSTLTFKSGSVGSDESGRAYYDY